MHSNTVKKRVSLGDSFGKFTVLEKVDRPSHLKHRGAYYRCRCECGDESIIRGDRLTQKRNPVKSCGCIPNSTRWKDQINPGDVFGEYAIIRRLPDHRQIKPRSYVYWECMCSCGRICIVLNKHLHYNKPHNLHCDDPSHPSKYLKYPPSKEKMPGRVGQIITNYRHMIEKYAHKGFLYDIAYEALERAAWIIWYKELEGIYTKEEAYINKCLSFTEKKARYFKAMENREGSVYNYGKSRGRVMTNPRMTIEAIIQTLPNPITPESKPRKPKRFKRC